MQVKLLGLISKITYLIVPKGTKFMGSDSIRVNSNLKISLSQCLISINLFEYYSRLVKGLVQNLLFFNFNCILFLFQLIVATEQEEIPRLENLFKRGQQNNCKDLRIIGPDEIKQMEPHCRVSDVCQGISASS